MSSSPCGGQPQRVQAAPDLGVLQAAQVAVHIDDQIVEPVVTGCVTQPEVLVDGGLGERLPDPVAQRGQLRGVQALELAVLVEELLQPRRLVVGVGPGHRGQQVVDDDGVGAPLGLRSLPGIVDDEGVEEGHVGEGGVGPAARGEGQRLAGQPLQGAVLAEVDDGVGAPDVVQPAVEGQVVVGRGEVGRVVDGDRVVAVAPGRLDRHQHVPELDPAEHEPAVVDAVLPWRRTPGLLQLPAGLGGQRGEPAAVVGHVHRADGAIELGSGERVGVVGEAVGQLRHQRVAVRRRIGHAVAGLGQRVEQPHGAGRRVETDRVAEPAALGGISAEHDHDPLVAWRGPAQVGLAQGQAHEAGPAVGHGAVGPHHAPELGAVVDHLVEGEHRADDPTVELGNGHAGGGVVGPETAVVGQPLVDGLPGRGRLQDGHAQGGQRRRVPLFAVEPAGRARGARSRHRAAGRQHGGDEDVHLPFGEQFEDGPGGITAQRVAPDGHHLGAPTLDLVAQVGDELGVPGHEVGAVEDDTDARSVGAAPGLPPDAVGRDLHRCAEAEAFEQHGVGHESEKLGEVLRSAVDQVGEGVRDGGARHRREGRQLGVRDGLAGEGEKRDAPTDAAPTERVETVLPRPPPPEQPDEHAGRAVEVALDVVRPRLRSPHRWEAVRQGVDSHPQGEDLGVDVGEVPDHGRSLPASAAARDASSSARSWRLQSSQYHPPSV